MELVYIDAGSPWVESAGALYREAFPKEERREDNAMLPEDCHFRPGVLTEKGEFRGILFYWESREFIYLEHFAIAPSLRGGGLGAKALALLKSKGKPIVLEIELPVDGLTRRRKAFYERNGFLENPWQHIQPIYRADDEPLPLMLLSCPEILSEGQWQGFEGFLAEHVAVKTGNA